MESERISVARLLIFENNSRLLETNEVTPSWISLQHLLLLTGAHIIQREW